MYCKNCGKQLDDHAVICPGCGVPANETLTSSVAVSAPNLDDGVCWPWGVLCFLVPIAGLILYAVWRKQRPRHAKACGIGALVLVIFEALLVLALVICSAVGLLDDGVGWDIVWIAEEYQDNIYHSDDVWGDGFTLTYENSDDGVISLANCGVGCKTEYDAATDSLIAFYDYGFAVFNRTSGEKLLSRTTSLAIRDVSAYDGMLYVGFAKTARRIDIYDLTTGELQSAIHTRGNVGELVATEGKIIYAEADQRCNIYALDLDAGTERYITYANYPALGIAHELDILYIVERHSSNSSFFFVDLSDFSINRVAESGNYVFNVDGVYFDGENVHAFGNVYSATTGYMIASRGYVENINAENLGETLCANGNYVLISTTLGKTVVYDRTENKIVYTAEVDATRIYAISETLYVAECGGNGTFVTIDLSNI